MAPRPSQSLALLSLFLSCFFDFGFRRAAGASPSQESKVYIVYMGNTGGVEPEILVANHLDILTKTLGSRDAAGTSLIYSYKHGFNGFSALLTEDHALTLAAMPGVVGVFPSQRKELHTSHSWDFLGLSLEKAIQIGSTNGEDVIIGLIDSGVWPTSPSFNDSLMGPTPARWKGTCMPGESFDSSNCNRKLIGARYYDYGWSKAAALNDTTDSGLLIRSALDTQGHGTHTASTAGGSVVEGAGFAGLLSGRIRGGSPKARIAIYKVCWKSVGCDDADMLAAFDDAIHDGVDILSLSIGPKVPDIPDYIQQASAIGSFHAMQHGILTVCAAGNDGPAPFTIGNTEPWVLTVAASTTNRDVATNVLLGNNETLQGSSLFLSKMAESSYGLVFGGDIPAASVASELASLCLLGSLDPLQAAGKIVLCVQRGHDNVEPNIVTKSVILQQIGAAGMIIVDNASFSIASSFVIPSTTVSLSVGDRILSYIRSTTQPSAVILTTQIEFNVSAAPAVAGFSSRGPNILTSNILKPDITAPGVSILASYTPLNSPDLETYKFFIDSGTSMSAPHVSGAAALVKAAHPMWSPSAIKSALMTTATNRNDHLEPLTTDVGDQGTPLDFGSGHLNPLGALEPGLVYDAGEEDYIQFLCYYGYNQAQVNLIVNRVGVSCPAVSAPELISQINLPSIAMSQLTGIAKIIRTVTNVSPQSSTYTPMVEAPPGVSVTVFPAELEFSEFVKQITYELTLEVLESSYGKYVFGSITWSDGTHRVHSPIAIASASL